MSAVVLKSLTACVVSMAAAAGVTWFGTAPDGSVATDGQPHPPAAKEDADTKVRSGRDRAESRVVVSAEAEASPTRGLPPRPRERSDTTVSVIDRLMRDAPARSRSGQDSESKRTTDNKPEGRASAKDDTEKRVRIRIETDVDDHLDLDALSGDEVEAQVLEDVMAEFDKVISDLEIEMKQMEGDVVRLRGGTLSGAVADADEMSMELPMTGSLRSFYKAKPTELLATTETIDDADLRDQALYAVVVYALEYDEFGTARKAVAKMDQRDLRDTALARVAIRHAELGDIDTAQSVIGDLENEELRDIIRVQMIETLTTPPAKRKDLPGY